MVNDNTDVPVYHRIERTEVLRVLILGFLAGILVPLIGMLISNWVINPIFCGGENDPAFCSNSSIIGYYVSTVIVMVGAIAVLANWGIYRPLIIGVGAAVALWGLQEYIDPLNTSSWLEYYIVSALLYGGMYLLLYWLMRVRNFAVSVVLAVVAIVALRWALLV